MLKKEIEGCLRKYKIELDPSSDEQHLIDYNQLNRMIDLAGIKTDDTVLEIGAGCGILTEVLAKNSGRVFAVEKNSKFLPILSERLAKYKNVEIMIANAIDIQFPDFTKIVSNMPHAICEALFQKLVNYSFRVGVLIVPEPFARTLLAKPRDPKYSKLSMMASYFYEFQLEGIVDLECFYPRPRVPSIIIKLIPKATIDLETLTIRSFFLQRDRKTKNALRDAMIEAYAVVFQKRLTKKSAKKIIESLGIDSRFLELKVARLSLEGTSEVIREVSERASTLFVPESGPRTNS